MPMIWRLLAPKLFHDADLLPLLVEAKPFNVLLISEPLRNTINNPMKIKIVPIVSTYSEVG